MSNLIRREEGAGLSIDAFHVEDLGEIHKSSQGKVGPGRRKGIPAFNGDPAVSGRKPSENLHEKIAHLEREAYEKGFEQGHKDSLALGEKRVQESMKQAEALLGELGRLKRYLYFEAERDLVRLSVEIARKIIREEIKMDPGVVTRAVRAALNFLVDRGRIRVLISPEDMKEVQKHLPDLAVTNQVEQLTLVEDRAIEKGGCILETGFGKINATLEEQISYLRKELEEELECRKGETCGGLS